MYTISCRSFFEQRLELAKWIVKDKGKNFEADADILICCALGALAARLWPGAGIDRQRFTQLLADYSINVNLRIISTPVLAWQLRDQGDKNTATSIASCFFPSHPSNALQPAAVDKDESVIIKEFSHLDRKVIRRASYASIIYTDLRCGLVHEYEFSPPITSSDPFETQNAPYYLTTTYESGKSQRLLHLPFGYIVDVMGELAESLFKYWDNATRWEKPRPANWWIDA